MKLKRFFLCWVCAVFFSPLVMGQNASLESYERHWDGGYKKIRVISYNILNGFGWRKDTDRQNRFVEWVKQKDPEVLALQELCGFTQETLSALARQWGHPYAVIHKEDGYPVGITSKEPIKLEAKVTENCGHGLLHVKTYGYDFLVTHLNPHNVRQRRVEAETIINYIEEHQLDSCMLMGDFNSHSPFDADYMEANATDLKRKYGGDDSPNLADGDFDYSVIGRILSLPFIDTGQKFIPADERPSFPSPILMYLSRNEMRHKRISERLDYIFVTPSIFKDVTDAFVYNKEDNDYLSDHYPVAIDLCVKRKQK